MTAMSKRKKKPEVDDRVKTIDITKMSGGKKDLTEEQIASANKLIEMAARDGYRITQLSFF